MKCARRGRCCALMAAIWLLLTAIPSAALDFSWGGHFRLQGSAAHYEASHLLRQGSDRDIFLDGGADFRLTTFTGITGRLSLAVDYEAAAWGGDTHTATWAVPSQTGVVSPTSGPPSDETQLLSLTRVLSEYSGYTAYHRIDRLAAAYTGDRGTVTVGRQALSWGNGFIFNPMDLINPFAPTDLIRDYKYGSDMVVLQTFGEWLTDFQAVWVPRRVAQTGSVAADSSTFSAKGRFSAGGLDWDVMASRNWGDTVLGSGILGTVGPAAWRSDVTYTFLKDDPDRSGFLSAVANIDVSWTWGDRNWYGFIEAYFNGLGSNDPIAALQDPALRARIRRGELFTTGRWYLDAELRWELHPLVNLYFSGIWNLADASVLLQPRATWDMTASVQLMTGLDLPAGTEGTEFGGPSDPARRFTAGPPSRLYVLLTYYF